MRPIEAYQEIADTIIELRGVRIILDFHLAQLYDVETRVLKQQVRRNLDRFPQDFMFELADAEIDLILSQKVIPNRGVLGGAKPMAFSEQGVAMLSSVLRNKKAIEVNITIMRTFVHVRKILQDNTELTQKFKQLEKKYDEQLQVIFEAIKRLMDKERTERKPIGYKRTR